MDTFISLCPLIVALIPLGMALRAVLTDEDQPAQSPAAAFYDGNSNPSTFPSLTTMSELENTMPIFMKRHESWTE